MLSKWKPWEMRNNAPYLISENQRGVYCFFSYDPYLERLFLKKMTKFGQDRQLFGPENLQVLIGNELTVEWFENSFQSMSLFGSSNSYLILNADTMNMGVRNYLLTTPLDIGESYLIFSFPSSMPSNKKNKSFPELLHDAHSTYSFISLSEPAFWENQQLLNFATDEFKVTLPADIQQYFLEALEPTPESYFNALMQMYRYFSTRPTLEQIKELITPSRIDNFLLANLFGQRKINQFLHKLLHSDLESMRSFFSFMQGHLLKMIDPSYADSKARISKYDREIMAHAKLWEKNDLLKWMRVFGEMEIIAKGKDTFSLNLKLREKYLKSFS